MRRSSDKSPVKKTLVRNCELKSRQPLHKVIYDLNLRETGSSGDFSSSSQKENELNQPTLCSSESLANYLKEIKCASQPQTQTVAGNKELDSKEMSSKITKKLNFHFNDRMYKNLIELNANVDELKIRRDKKPPRSAKKDVEPNIQDFYEDSKQPDSAPKIPIIRPKFRPIKKVEDGKLHKLVASFDVL